MLHMVIILVIESGMAVWRAHAVALEKGSLKACFALHNTALSFSMCYFFPPLRILPLFIFNEHVNLQD